MNRTYFVRLWNSPRDLRAISRPVYRLTEGAFIFEVGSAVSRRKRKILARKLRAFAKE